MDHFTVDRYVCQDNTIVAIGATAWRNVKTNKHFETPIITEWKFKDGKAAYFFEYYDTARVAETAVP